MESQTTVKELLALLEKIASFAFAETWDNVGLMIGEPEQKISGLLVALDPTEQVLEEAVAAKVNTIITHHPLIFHPLKSIRTDQVIGRFLQRAMSKNISVIGCHTNLDVASGGVNDALANVIGLTSISPLTLKSSSKTGSAASGTKGDQESILSQGFGRIGQLKPALKSDAFLQHLFEVLSTSSLAVAGILPGTISTVAVCGGSGSDLAEKAYSRGADVYLTGEVKHSTARWAEASNFCVIDAGHFATENPVVETLSNILKTVLEENGKSIDILTAVNQKDPFIFYHR